MWLPFIRIFSSADAHAFAKGRSEGEGLSLLVMEQNVLENGGGAISTMLQ
jgi:hypothetical protein